MKSKGSFIEEEEKMRVYVIVIEEDGRKVVEVHESEEMTPSNARMVSKAVAERWRQCSEKYRPPTYDVLDGHANGRKELMEMLCEIEGWQDIEIQQIA